jgi:DNA-binding winged helix-turn-helix (wHTH) protein
MLTESAGQVVTREAIRERLWPKDTFVDFERGINFCINQIRSALGDHAEKPRFVETLPKRGYRFIAPVTVEVSREPAPVLILAAPANETPHAPNMHAASSESSGIQVLPHGPVKSTVAPRAGWRFAAVVTAISLASLAAGYGILSSHSRSRGPILQDVHMTKLTNSGAVTGVAISPDGRYALYSKLEDGKQGLWLHQVAAQREVPLLSPGTGFHGLTFSPDGDYVYFVRSDEHNDAFKYLYSMPVLGGPVKKLFTDVDSPVCFRALRRRDG